MLHFRRPLLNPFMMDGWMDGCARFGLQNLLLFTPIIKLGRAKDVYIVYIYIYIYIYEEFRYKSL